MYKEAQGKMRHGIKTRIACLLLLAGSTSANASMVRLESSVDQENYREAYSLAQTMVAARAGEPRFDYYLGLAALHTGNASEAVFALERATLNDPNNIHAMLALGESYMKAGQVIEGRETLGSLLQRRPPKSISTRAQQLLKYKVSSKKSESSAFRAYVDVSGGNDTNINSSTDIDSPIITSLSLSISLDPNAIGVEDNFTQFMLGAAGTYQYDITGVSVGISLRDRKNNEYDQYDSTVVTSFIGFNMGNSKHKVHLPVYHQDFNLDGNDYYAITASGLGYRYYLDNMSHIGLSAEVASQAYEVLNQLDSKTTTTSLAWKYKFKNGWTRVTVYNGSQDPDKVQAGINDYFARTFTGLRFQAEGDIARNHALYGAARYETSKYDEALYPGFNEYRDDSYSRYAIGWKWTFYKGTMVRLEYNATGNDSNIVLQDYDRTQYLLGLRYTY